MDLHVKPTSKHQYLYIKSCHPKHCNTAIPYSQTKAFARSGRTSYGEEIN